MPELGEIRQGKEIGKSCGEGYSYYIWATCPQCESQRWVRTLKDKPLHNLCKQCSDKQPLAEATKQKISQFYANRRGAAWKRGRWKVEGYMQTFIRKGDFFRPMADKQGRCLEHRLIVARSLNRCLLPWEIVHHKNGIRDDNRLQNLELLTDKRFHLVDSVMKQHITRLEAENKHLREQLNASNRR